MGMPESGDKPSSKHIAQNVKHVGNASRHRSDLDDVKWKSVQRDAREPNPGSRREIPAKT